MASHAHKHYGADAVYKGTVPQPNADMKISINHQDVGLNELEEKLRTIFEDRKDKTMFISADGALRYGDIVNVIDAAKGAGVEKVGIVTEGMRKGAAATPGA